MLMFGKRNSSIVLNKNNTLAEQQQVASPSIFPIDPSNRQKLPQKLYNSGF
jgi:hypothetical protein